MRVHGRLVQQQEEVIMKVLREVLRLVLFVSGLVLLPLACDRHHDHDMKDKIEDAGDKVKDGLEDAGHEVKEGVKDAGDKLEDAGDKIKDAAPDSL
jgi:hypothetical protein